MCECVPTALRDFTLSSCRLPPSGSAVVFLSFYQQILIAALVFWNVIKPTLEYSQEEVAKGLQDFIIVIEMGFAAVAHHYAFGYADFLRPDLAAELHVDRDAEGRVIAHHQGLGRALKDLIPLDVVKDTGATIVRGFGRMRSQQSGMSLPAAAAGAGLVDASPVVAAPSSSTAAAASGPVLAASATTVLELRDSPRHSTSADSAAVAASLAAFAAAGPSAGSAGPAGPAAASQSAVAAAPRTPSHRGAASGAGAVAVTIANAPSNSNSSTPAAASPAAVAVLNPLAAASATASPAAPPLPGATDAGSGSGSGAAEWR